MTASEILAERPDLALNWERAGDPQWLADNPGNDDVAQWIADFGSLENYLTAETGERIEPDPIVVETIAPPPVIQQIVLNVAPIQPPAIGFLPPVTQWVAPQADGSEDDDGESGSVDNSGATVQSANMTAEDFANAHPDLGLNWNRAHSAQWIAENPGNEAVVAGILEFPSFMDYLVAAHGGYFDAPSTVTTVAPPAGNTGYEPPANNPPPVNAPAAAGAPVQGASSHVYVGRTGTTDRWQIYDAANDRVIEWDVPIGADSRSAIGGSQRDLGAPSSMTIAQRPAGFVPTPAGIVVTNPPPVNNAPPAMPANPATIMTTRILHPVTGWPIDVPDAWHRVGDDAAGNPVFQLVDAGNQVKQWTIDGRGQVTNLVNAQSLGTIVSTTPPPSAPVVNPPPVNAPPGTYLPPGTTTATGSKSNVGLLLLLGVGAYFAFRN